MDWQGPLQETTCQETLKETVLLRIKKRLRGDTIIIFKYEKLLKRERK